MGFLPIPYLREHWADSYATATNLSYFVFGFMLFWIHGLWLMTLVFALVGVGSTGYHWLRSKAWHKFDLVAIIYCFGVIAGWLIYGPAGAIIGAWCACVVHYFYEHINPRIFIGAFGLVSLIAHGMQNPIEQTAFVLAVFATAFIVSTVAEKFYHRDHTKYDFLHGTWHLISSYGMYLLCIPPAVEIVSFATSQIFYT